ncbi:MAG: hypothetical protein CM15mP59_3980 [Flavobacteriaceae bacterium]|nr:MAG: hypothetical protein CM15mP59_3980 [Flavobacteriaceae bacterium]
MVAVREKKNLLPNKKFLWRLKQFIIGVYIAGYVWE